MNEITQIIIKMKEVEDKFRKIQENPALHGAENGLTAEELTILGKLIELIGEANIAADAILKRV